MSIRPGAINWVVLETGNSLRIIWTGSLTYYTHHILWVLNACGFQPPGTLSDHRRYHLPCFLLCHSCGVSGLKLTQIGPQF